MYIYIYILKLFNVDRKRDHDFYYFNQCPELKAYNKFALNKNICHARHFLNYKRVIMDIIYLKVIPEYKL